MSSIVDKVYKKTYTSYIRFLYYILLLKIVIIQLFITFGGGEVKFLTEDFISARDRIVSASIDIISDAGLFSLTMKNISMRTNISEPLIYKYYSNTDEILCDIVEDYFRFDNGIFKTISSKDEPGVKKVLLYVDAISAYYNSYYSISALMLQYEELLHNTNTREIIEYGYNNRRDFLVNLFKEAEKNKELKDELVPERLADTLIGLIHISILNRRVMNRRKSLKEDINLNVKQLMKTIVNNPEVLS